MKAFVLRAYGPPGQLALEEIDRPVPESDEVLIRVRASSVQPYDWHIMRGEPYAARLLPGALGLRRPTIGVLGADVAGQVEAAGKDVTRFRPGDEVFGMPKQGGFAEYVSVREQDLAPKPKNLSFEQAAAVPLACITALLAVRDKGHVQPGQKVLVNGASGGVGTFVVQLARAFGAEVTGVCSARNAELVRSIGANDVVDYNRTDFTRTGRRYDLLVDMIGSHPGSASRRALTREGTLVIVGGPAGRWLEPIAYGIKILAAGPFVSQRMSAVDVIGCTEIQQNLVMLTELIEAGRLTPVIDRSYPLAEVPAAVMYQEEGHAAGKVVITV